MLNTIDEISFRFQTRGDYGLGLDLMKTSDGSTEVIRRCNIYRLKQCTSMYFIYLRVINICE
jgi:hypothetical protein